MRRRPRSKTNSFGTATATLDLAGLGPGLHPLDIRFVAHTGDLVDWDTADHIQYVRASNALKKLDDARIPYALAIGNHDTAATCPTWSGSVSVRSAATWSAESDSPRA